MSSLKHGITIGIERYGVDFVIAFKAVGTLTHDDYETMVPVLEGALQGVKDPDIYVFVDVTELDGWELQAAWDDLKLGVKHAREFKKIAILGNNTTQELMAKLANWFTPAKVKYFVDQTDALSWLKD